MRESLKSVRKAIAEEKGVVNSMKWQAHTLDCGTFCTGEPKKITAAKVRDDLLSTDSLIAALLPTQVGFRDFHEEESTLVSLSDLKYPLAFLLSNHLLCTMLCHGN